MSFKIAKAGNQYHLRSGEMTFLKISDMIFSQVYNKLGVYSEDMDFLYYILTGGLLLLASPFIRR